ncbi:MAG: hypothetical protein ABSE84_18745 [Isosphaeraceae bacterium]|jgi:hypothetical protein
MGHWGVKSYENDDADDALDAGFEEVHGDLYKELMDDRNPLSFEQVQKRLADGWTLTAAVAVLEEMVGAALTSDSTAWDEAARLALAGIVVRHAECGVPIPHDLLNLALEWLEHEEIDWDEETKRRLRREKEISLLRPSSSAPPDSVEKG